MIRARRFCPYCGQVIDPRSESCLRHRDLIALDPAYSACAIPPDPLESIPMHAADLTPGEAAKAAREREGC